MITLFRTPLERLLLPIVVVMTASLLYSCKSYVVIPMHRNVSLEGYPSYWLEGYVNGNKINLFVDTGSSLPVISKEFVEQHELQYAAEHMQNADLEDSFIDIVRPQRLRIGRLVARESVFQVRDTLFVSQLLQGNVEGIVGGGLFNSNRYSLSFKENLIRYGKFSIENENMYPLEIDDQYLYANVKVNGVVSRFLIDSGALQTQISLELAEKVLDDLSSLEFENLRRVTIDEIREVRLARVMLSSLSFGDETVENFSVFAGDYTKNILGIDFLHAGVLTIDPESLTFGYRVD